MPRGFKEEEKERIRIRLIEEGSRLFGQYGLRKTSIDELVKAAGIAKGSFYRFFPTKEALFFACLELQELDLQEKHLRPVFENSTDATEMFTRLFQFISKLPREYPLISATLKKEEYEELLHGVPEEQVLAHRKKDQQEMEEFMAVWKGYGIEINENPETLNGLFQSLFLLSLHRREIGETIFDNSMDLLGKVMAEGMVSLYGSGRKKE